MQEPLISILTPFKNTEAYISECLESITNQTCSMDNSYSIIENYAQKDSRIRLLKNPGNGIIEALRHAYNNSKGELITRMDSDDVMMPNKHNWRDYNTRTSRTHEHYAENHFLDLKLHYFLKLDYDDSRPLAIWGAGNKGKTIAKKLISKEIPFHWICDNPKKIGKDIYGKTLLNFDYLKELDNPQSIITVANPEAQTEIRKYMVAQKMKSVTDYFFFC